MAEVGGLLASAVLNVVFRQIGAAIGGQIELHKNFTKDLNNMKMTLESVAAVLKHAERQSIENETVLLWLKRLKDAMYGISDMLDEIEADNQPAGRKIFLKKLVSVGPNHKLANRMKTMREQLTVITDQRVKFTLEVGSTTNEQRFRDPRITTSIMNDEELIVGRTTEKRNIIVSISERMTGRITIFPIYGIAGIGKTTLAKMVFNDTQFEGYFRVWVYVSQKFDLDKIGNSIISQLSKVQSQLTDSQMIHNSLVELLAGKKVLIVLDDLWEDDGSQLTHLKDMLMVGAGSKIIVIVTTRNEGVADKLHTIEPCKLAPLSDDSCWTIIKQKSDFDSRVDKKQLKQIGMDIAVKCGGVALAAQSLGHMLQPLTSDEWESVRNSNMWNNNDVLSSLKLSYSYMTSHLKLCFAYCAIFLKGQNIDKDELIHQWDSLGFIEASHTFSTEQLGEKYIKQLLGLSFLQPSRSHNSGVHHKDFTHLTMHDLVHDLARLVLADELLLSVSNQGCTGSKTLESYTDSPDKIRTQQEISNQGLSCRYALLNDCSKRLESYTDSPAKIRALRFHNCRKIGLQEDGFSSAKYLRVLDLSECFLRRIPDSIGQLKQLRYLNAPGIQHQMVPNSITKLIKLIYLSLCGSSTLMALPDSIGQMEGLMYLDLSGCSGLEKLPKSFGKLKQLVHLDLSNCSNITGVSEPLQSLTNIEYLNLSYCWNIKALPGNLGSLMKLKYLNLSGCVEIEEFPRSLANLKKLMHLDLSHCCEVKVIPEILGSLTKLQYLNISQCGCIGGNKIAEALGNLTKLQHLYLSGFMDTICDESTISTLSERKLFISTFLGSISTLPVLKHLDLSCNESLHYLPECIGSLSELSTLNVSDCSYLEVVPESIVQLDSLKMVYAKNCSSFVTQFLGRGLNKSSTMLPEFCVDLDDLKGSNLALFQAVNVTKLFLRGLGNVKSVEEVQRIKLEGKQGLKELTLSFWGSGWPVGVKANEVLGSLVPPSTIETLSIMSYSGVMFPDWLAGVPPYHFPNLVDISLSNLNTCICLPPLGQLPNLKKLDLRRMEKVAKIDENFCGGPVAFPQLESFSLSGMQNLEVWDTMHSYRGDGVSRYMFPCLRELNVDGCPKLRLRPCPPKAEKWTIQGSDGVVSSWGETGRLRLTPVRPLPRLLWLPLCMYDTARCLCISGRCFITSLSFLI